MRENPAPRCFASVWRRALPCSSVTLVHGGRSSSARMCGSGLPRKPLRSLNFWTMSRRDCGSPQFHLAVRQHLTRGRTRQRKHDSGNPISTEVGEEAAMKPDTLEECGTPKVMAPLHVLIVEHSPDDVELMLLQLREAGLGFDYVTAEDRDQFRRALQEKKLDRNLSDYLLPHCVGLD